MAAKKSATGALTAIFWLTSIVFFISGGTGLIYQVVWFRRFSHVWGSSSLAFAAVGASFLFGLGLGAYLIGRSADRVVVPLRWYGVCELLIGVLAIVIPFEIAALVDAAVGLYAAIPEQPLLRYLMQFAITLVVIGPPCVLMGGTLPLLIRQLTAREGSLDQATGWLYAINTFGAAAGCYLAGFHLLPAFGTLWTNYAAAATNIAIGLVSLLASNSVERLVVARSGSRHAVETPPAAGLNARLFGLYLATALSGCAALVLEMTWTRQLALVLGGSTYAYTATLFVVLIGIAIGSLVFHVFLRPVASSPVVPMAVFGVILVSVVVGIWMLPQLSIQAGEESLRKMRGSAFMNGLVCVGISGLLEFVPAVSMGILFPLFVHLTQASAAKVGATVGRIYAWNTLGSIVGASLTSVLLFPWIGTAGATALAAGMYGVSLVAVLPWQGAGNLARVAVAAAAGAAAVVMILRPTDPQETNLGLYLYGSKDFAEERAQMLSRTRPVLFIEGASSNVLVTKNPQHAVALRVNGKVDASNGLDMATQVGSAYFPRIFKPDAKEVLVIGYGSGCTPGRSLLFPDTHVTCCELEPAVYEASEHFGIVNGRPHRSTRAWLEAHNSELPPDQRLSKEEIDKRATLSMVFGDGRTAVQGSAKKYDLVISEPSNPWIAGCSNLFTQEFFHATREHLNEGGVLAQWIQAYSFTLADYLMIVRTMRTEFPYYGVIVLAGGVDTLLLASDKPLVPGAAQLESMQRIIDQTPIIKNDLDVWFGGSDVRWLLLSNYLLGKEQLDQLIKEDGSQAINTDLHLRLEFDAPLHLFRDLDPEKFNPKEMANVRLPAAGGKWLGQLATQLGITPGTADFYAHLGDYALNQGKSLTCVTREPNSPYLQKAAARYEQARRVDPMHAAANRGLNQALLRASLKEALGAQVPEGPPDEDPRKKAAREKRVREEEVAKRLRKLIELDPQDAVAHYQLAETLVRADRRREALEEYRQALKLQKEVSFDLRTFAWANELAWLLSTSVDEKMLNPAEAVPWAKAACEVTEYDNPALLDTLGAALAADGQFDEAIKVSRRAIALSGDRPDVVATIEDRIKLYEASKRYVDTEHP